MRGKPGTWVVPGSARCACAASPGTRDKLDRMDYVFHIDNNLVSPMDTVTLSTKYQLVIPRAVRERLDLEPGTKLTVIEKGGILYLVPERPLAELRGIARGTRRKGLREKKDRL